MLLSIIILFLNTSITTGLRIQLCQDTKHRYLINSTRVGENNSLSYTESLSFVSSDSASTLQLPWYFSNPGMQLEALSTAAICDGFQSGTLSTTALPSHLGIGPESEFIDAFGSASVIQREHETILLFGDDEMEAYNSSCHPNSLMAISLINTSVPFMGSLRVLNSIGDNILSSSELPVNLSYQEFSEGVLFSVPPEFEDLVDAILLQNHISMGFETSAETGDVTDTFITSCTRDVLNIFPTVVVSLSGSDGPSGSIVFHPEDYIRLDAAHNTCHFKYILGPDRDTPMLMNPVLFPGVNARFTRDAMYLCDSI